MILRPRQQESVDKAIEALSKFNNTVVVAPTGAGKTVIFSSVIKQFVDANPNMQVVVIAHRDELTYQNQDKFLMVAPNVTTSVVNADKKDWSGQVVFAMVQTLTRDEHLRNMPPTHLLVVDEAHHVTADSYLKILNSAKDQNPYLKLFGVTATPIRGDKTNLGKIFTNCSDQIELSELINSGHLVPPVTYRIDTGETAEKLQALQVKASGDYSEEEMSEIMNTVPLNSRVVEEWKERARKRKTVVFCTNIGHAEKITKEFRRQRIRAGLITGRMSAKERQDKLNALTAGRLQVIVNVAILIEGWDYPPISCVILLRSSSYKSTMIQMIGRGLRTIDPSIYPKVVKFDCLILDFGISTILHGNLIQRVDLKDKETGIKFCPACRKPIPKASDICPLCDTDTKAETEAQEHKFTIERRVLEDFTMKEINLLENLAFAWTELKTDTPRMIAAGFDSWACVLKHNDIWMAVGGVTRNVEEQSPARILYNGAKLQALAAGNDFLYKHETNESANKLASWRNDKPSEPQLRCLPNKYKGETQLTKGDVSSIITYDRNAKSEIESLLESEANEVYSLQ
jgi:DNA repair protein RadD